MFNPMKHNYYKKLLKLHKQGKIPAPSLSLVDIYHDHWCGINKGRYCNCNPDIKLRPLGGSGWAQVN